MDCAICVLCIVGPGRRRDGWIDRVGYITRRQTIGWVGAEWVFVGWWVAGEDKKSVGYVCMRELEFLRRVGVYIQHTGLISVGGIYDGSSARPLPFTRN